MISQATLFLFLLYCRSFAYAAPISVSCASAAARLSFFCEAFNSFAFSAPYTHSRALSTALLRWYFGQRYLILAIGPRLHIVQSIRGCIRFIIICTLIRHCHTTRNVLRPPIEDRLLVYLGWPLLRWNIFDIIASPTPEMAVIIHFSIRRYRCLRGADS